MRTLKIIVPLFLAFGLHACGEIIAAGNESMSAQALVPAAYSQSTTPRQ